MLGVADPATAIVAIMTLLVHAIRLMAAQAMIVFGVSYSAAPIVATMPLLVHSLGFAGHADDDRAQDLSTRPRPSSPRCRCSYISLGFMATQSMVVLGIGTRGRAHRRPDGGICRDDPSRGRAGDGHALGRLRAHARRRRDGGTHKDGRSHGRANDDRARDRSRAHGRRRRDGAICRDGRVSWPLRR